MSASVQTRPIPTMKPPASRVGAAGWLRANLFNSVFNTIITLLVIYFLIRIIPSFIRWAVIDSVFWTSGQECKAVSGACWSVVVRNIRFIIFGFYPYDQQWRPLAAMALLIGLLFYSRNRHHWKKSLLWFWLAGLFMM